MRPALLVFLYGLAVAWYLPALLTRLTASGISARLGLVAWLTAMASVLASFAVALLLLVRAAIAGWSGLAEAVCRSVAGGACAPVTYRNAIFELVLAVAAIAAAAAVIVLAWRYGRGVQQDQRRTRAHAEGARIAGRLLPGAGTAVVLDVPQRAAYCLPGRPGTIVLTTGALAVLDSAQLSAVLAHERAHLAGRHHLLIALSRGLAAGFPAVPVFTQAQQEVARLAEMCADDAAARRTGRRTLIAALLAMGTGTAGPAAALAATACAVTARVQRLLDPPRRGRRARYGLALLILTILLALASGLVTTVAGLLAVHGMAG